MIVMKFGGTSVEDSSAISRLIDIVFSAKSRSPLVVVSACSGVTNDLLLAAKTVAGGDKEKALNILDRLRGRHKTIATELLPAERRDPLFETIDQHFQELRNYVRGVFLLGELTPRSLDAITSHGEQLSSLIIHAAMEERNLRTYLLDARQVMLTDSAFTAARPLMEKIDGRIQQIVQPVVSTGTIVITQGFIGATEQGITTTIGRGGSDYSASIFGAALGAEEIQIWTDVDGMMTTDSRIVPGARLIGMLTFDEASELAYFGAKVLHPSTILPAIGKNIPVRILNSRKPESPGTLIVNNTDNGQQAGETAVKAIACKQNITLVNVGSSRMLMAHGFLAELFSVFARYQKSVDVISTSEVSVSLTLDNEENLPAIRNDLESIAEIKIKQHKAIVCVVGEAMRQSVDVPARIFNALAKEQIPIEMISEGASEINLTMVVEGADVARAVSSLHNEFFPMENR